MSGETCVASGGTATCEARVCTPLVIYCDAASPKVLQCSADGLSSSLKADCGAMNKLCIAGTCTDATCQPGKTYCVGNQIRQCNASGDDSTLVQACSTTQYCDATTVTCKALVCMPQQPSCDGNVATTCNGDGSGFTPGGVDCAPKQCADGACVEYLFRETFENGKYDDSWVGPNPAYTRSVVSSDSAPGSGYHLDLVKAAGAPLTAIDGLYHTFAPPLKPKTIRWWMRANTIGLNGNATWSLSGTKTFDVLGTTQFFYNDPTTFWLSLGNGNGIITTRMAVPPGWYHFEMRNIDWSTGKYQFYVTDPSGSLIVDNQPATLGNSGVGFGVGRLDLSNFAGGDSSSWDDIEFLP
jgi:hypothetical protein